MTDFSRRQLLGGAALATLAATLPATARAQGTVASPDAIKPRVTAISRVIIDTDPGNDDALALLLALDAPNLHVEAITVCPGNLGPNYAQQVRNALYIVEVAGKAGKVPVHAGMTHPLLNRPYPVASFIHGKYGLGDVEVPVVKQQIAPEHAVDAMRRIINGSPGEITILALGGLTNVAMAILRDPAVVKNLKGILFIGGRYAAPPPVPGYNVLVDPEAADIVFKSGVPILLVGSDVIGRDSIMHDDDFDRVAAFNTARSRFFIASNNLRRQFEKANRGTTGSTNPDPLGVAIAIDPSIATRWVSLYVHVELTGELTRGMLIYGDNIYTLAPTPPPTSTSASRHQTRSSRRWCSPRSRADRHPSRNVTPSGVEGQHKPWHKECTMKTTWVLAVVLSFAMLTPGQAFAQEPDIGYGPTPAATIQHVFPTHAIRRINVAEPYAVVSASGTGSLFDPGQTREFLLEHFYFGWQVIDIAPVSCARERGITAAMVRNLMAGMPKRVTREANCDELDSGPARSVAQVRSLMYGPVVPYTRVVDGYAFSSTYGDGGGCGLFRYERGAGWTKLGGCKGAMDPNVLTDNHIPHEIACKLRPPVAGLRNVSGN